MIKPLFTAAKPDSLPPARVIVPSHHCRSVRPIAPLMLLPQVSSSFVAQSASGQMWQIKTVPAGQMQNY